MWVFNKNVPYLALSMHANFIIVRKYYPHSTNIQNVTSNICCIDCYDYINRGCIMRKLFCFVHRLQIEMKVSFRFSIVLGFSVLPTFATFSVSLTLAAL